MNKTILVALAVVAMAAPATAKQNTRLTVLFEADSDVLTSEAEAQIATFAREYQANMDKRVKVDGHGTLAESEDNSAGYAVGLSQRRANTVRSALVAQGVRPSAVVTAAYGARRPLDGFPAASPRNRRVELLMTDDTGW